MAFDITNFGPVGGQASRGKAPQVFSYKTTDAATAVDASGYFNDAYGMLSVGDIIEVVTTTSDVPTAYSKHIVVSRASNVVDVSNTLSTVALSDTD